MITKLRNHTGLILLLVSLFIGSAIWMGAVQMGAIVPAADAKRELRIDYNCSDFLTHDDALAVFYAAGGPGQDPYDLDRDADGIPCEALLYPRP